MVALTLHPIDIQKIIEDVSAPEAGGVDVFVGSTRNHSKGKSVTLLEYEAYQPMAMAIMEQLEQRARDRWPLESVEIVHRLGKVAVGEASVVIAVSSAHRADAFEACRFLIDTLKKEVPIWKREHFADGSVERSEAGMTAGQEQKQ